MQVQRLKLDTEAAMLEMDQILRANVSSTVVFLLAVCVCVCARARARACTSEFDWEFLTPCVTQMSPC